MRGFPNFPFADPSLLYVRFPRQVEDAEVWYTSCFSFEASLPPVCVSRHRVVLNTCFFVPLPSLFVGTRPDGLGGFPSRFLEIAHFSRVPSHLC